MRRQALVIHENVDVRKTVKGALEPECWQLDFAGSLREGLDYFSVHPCSDLVLLGLFTPIADSMETLYTIHQNAAVPIIVLAAQEDEDECLSALEQGATDYVLTPIKPNILLARVRIATHDKRRADWPGQQLVYHDDYLMIDLDRSQVSVRGEPVRLSAIEYRLLKYLMQNRGCVLTHRQILANVWGWEFQDKVEYLHVYTSHLRQKLEANPRRPCYLFTEFGIGYRFLSTRRTSTCSERQFL